MKLLVDTHAFLWFVVGDKRLGRQARRQMEAKGAELFLSAASVWEMAIKASLGRLTLPASVHDYVEEKIDSGFNILPVDWTHAAAVAILPFRHKDPFDRLIIAQGMTEGMPVVSGDPVFRAYGVKTVW